MAIDGQDGEFDADCRVPPSFEAHEVSDSLMYTPTYKEDFFILLLEGSRFENGCKLLC